VNTLDTRSVSVLTPLPEEVNNHRHFGTVGRLWQRQAELGAHFIEQAEPEPRPYSALDEIEEITPGELSRHVLFVPNTRFHLRVGFEDGAELYLSFDGWVYTERDDLNSYSVPEVYNLHVDGMPASEGDVDFLFEDGLKRLEQWLLENVEVSK
jgi:hypothetical protein